MKLFIILPIVLIFIWFSLFSRSYFSEHGTDNPYFLAISGLRAIDIGYKDYDPYDGRLFQIKNAFQETKKNFIGKGVQRTGYKKGLRGSPAGGWLYWMYLTGFPGLFFLLIRDFNLFIALYKNIKINHNILFIGQALTVILVQQTSYGSLMDPNYFIVAVAVLISTFWIKKENINILNKNKS